MKKFESTGEDMRWLTVRSYAPSVTFIIVARRAHNLSREKLDRSQVRTLPKGKKLGNC